MNYDSDDDDDGIDVAYAVPVQSEHVAGYSEELRELHLDHCAETEGYVVRDLKRDPLNVSGDPTSPTIEELMTRAKFS